jgi:ATP-dependent Lon protease
MRTSSVLLEPPFQPEQLLDTLLPHFHWAGRWSIRASSGLTAVVSRLLADIEDILGPEPALEFLRIVEESRENEPYLRTLRVFIEPKTRIDAQISALTHAIDSARAHSKTCCFRCGETLQSKDVYDEDERQQHPFLAQFKTDDRFPANAVRVCMTCAAQEWSRNQPQQEQTKSALVKHAVEEAVDNVFDSIELDDEAEARRSEAVADSDPAFQDVAGPKAVTVTLYSLADVDRLEQNYREAPRDQSNRIKSLVKRIREGSPEKRLAAIPEHWRAYCDELARKFPNFKQVIRFIRNQMALSQVSDGVLRLPPLLLVGGPGVGKTEFMLTLANGCQIALEIIDISSAQTGSALAGAESYWSNSQPGRLFNTLVLGEVANPLIMLDEIDKARIDNAYKPLSALHQLLEPRQARQFYDLSLPELKFDASHVIWIATANSLDTLEKPIIDRFAVFHIEEPSKEQMVAIVNNLYERFINHHPSGGFFEQTIGQEAMAALCAYHPRKVRKLLDLAFGQAAYEARNYLIAQDIHENDGDVMRKHGIGFLSAHI